MVNRNIQMKKKNNEEWENLFPLTLNENVFNNDGIDLNTQLENIEHTTEEKLDQQNKEFTQFKNEMNQNISDLDLKVDNYIHINNYDVDPTGEKDSLEGFKNAFNDLKDNQTLILENNATYYLSETLNISKQGSYKIYGNDAVIKIDAKNDTDGLYFSGVFNKELNPLSTIEEGNNKITVSNLDNLEIGDLLYFSSNDQYNSSRSYYKKGGVFTIIDIDKNKNLITFSGSFPYNINETLTIKTYKPLTLDIHDLSIIGLNNLPNGRWGLCLEYTSKCKIENVLSDNWNHCITSRYSYSPIFEHVTTRRSFFTGTSESYGLSIYVNSFANIRNSDMYSGRHGFEVSGFENSFKTKIENSSVYSENDEFDLNTHQCSHDLKIINVMTGTVGLSAFTTIENSQLGRGEGIECTSQIKSSQTHDLSQFVIRNCRISGKHTFNFRSDHYDNPSQYFGDFIMEDNEVTDQIMLGVSLSSHRFNINRIILRNTDNVSTIFYYGSTVNNFIYEDSRFTTIDQPFLRMANDAVINRFVLRNVAIYIENEDFQFMELKNINGGLIDGCSIGSINEYTTNDIYLSSHEEQVPYGDLFITNMNLQNTKIKIRVFKNLAISNCYNVTLDGKDSLENYFPPSLREE